MMYQVLGFGTEHMTELAIVDTVEMIGPIGRGWQPPEGCKRALIVAGGVGSAPLYPLVEELTAAGVATDAILGASTIDALVARERYGAVLGCEPACSTDDGTYGRASVRRSWKRPWRRPRRRARPTTTWPAAARSPS